MKYPAKLLIILILVFLISGCKDENNVEPVIPPTTQNPNSPELVTPLNNQVLNTMTPALDWQDYNNTASYRVQVSLDANINGTMILDTVVGSSNLSIPPGKLSVAIYFYWRVIANLQGGGNSNWSSVWRFLVIFSPPAPPILVSPSNNSINIPFMPLFDWNESQTAEF